MKNLSKKHIVKIPKHISVFYSEKNQIITVVGSLRKKSLKLKTRLVVSLKKKC